MVGIIIINHNQEQKKIENRKKTSKAFAKNGELQFNPTSIRCGQSVRPDIDTNIDLLDCKYEREKDYPSREAMLVHSVAPNNARQMEQRKRKRKKADNAAATNENATLKLQGIHIHPQQTPQGHDER